MTYSYVSPFLKRLHCRSANPSKCSTSFFKLRTDLQLGSFSGPTVGAIQCTYNWGHISRPTVGVIQWAYSRGHTVDLRLGSYNGAIYMPLDCSMVCSQLEGFCFSSL